MSEPEGANWETANGFTARGTPVWQRQLAGAVTVALFGAILGWPDLAYFSIPAGPMRDEALGGLVASAIAWLVLAAVVRFSIFVGWRVVDEVDIDFQTSALRFAQRKIGGRRQRSVQAYDVASVKEVSYGSYRGHPLDWFVFKLKSGDKMRFRCPPGLLSMTRRSLHRAGLLDGKSLKGIAADPTGTFRGRDRA